MSLILTQDNTEQQTAQPAETCPAVDSAPGPCLGASTRRQAELYRQREAFWWDHIKIPTPACHGLPNPTPSLRELAARGLIAADVHFRSHADVDGAFARYIEDRLEQFPFLDGIAPKPVHSWPAHMISAIHSSASPPPLAVNVSVDLFDNAKRILAVCLASEALGDEFASACRMRRALVRYAMFLQLASSPEAAGVRLVPALDVAYVQLAHIIRTDAYRADMRLLQRPVQVSRHWAVLDASGSTMLTEIGAGESADDVARDVARTRELWQARFAEPYVTRLADLWAAEPSAAEAQAEAAGAAETVSVSVDELLHDRDWIGGFRLVVGSEAKMAALVAGDANTYAQLMHDYERFVFLAAKHPGRRGDEYVTVRYDADLIWHAHQLQAGRYEMDCLRLYGSTCFHEPWPKHTEEEERANSRVLRELHRQQFGTSF